MDGYAQNVRDENDPLLKHIEMAESKVASTAAEVALKEEKVQEVKLEKRRTNNQLRSLKDKIIFLVLRVHQMEQEHGTDNKKRTATT
mmetsp:Transcript_40623/g.45391  ORF Transcript_40623/g.45391 Transcript_40623/m.45391 type:complete len:87 (-) Transcript_40623:47-307(-)